jgi:hypothetical protein
MWEAVAEGIAPCDPSAVWALWEDPTRWKDWNDQIATAKLHGGLRIGSTARIRFKRAPFPLTFVITELQAGRSFTDETVLPGVHLGHEHLVERSGDSARIRHRLYLRGRAQRVYAVLLGRQMRSAVARFIERERAIVEKPSP